MIDLENQEREIVTSRFFLDYLALYFERLT